MGASFTGISWGFPRIASSEKLRRSESVNSTNNICTNSHGLCIGYKCLLTKTTELANRVCNFYHDNQTVCPPQLKLGVFTTGAMDNVDNNTSAISSKESFHGTAISLTQHPTINNPGSHRGVEVTYDNSSVSTSIRQLPPVNTDDPPVSAGATEYSVPKLDGHVTPGHDLVATALETEQTWLKIVQSILQQKETDNNEHISSCSTENTACSA